MNVELLLFGFLSFCRLSILISSPHPIACPIFTELPPLHSLNWKEIHAKAVNMGTTDVALSRAITSTRTLFMLSKTMKSFSSAEILGILWDGGDTLLFPEFSGDISGCSHDIIIISHPPFSVIEVYIVTSVEF